MKPRRLIVSGSAGMLLMGLVFARAVQGQSPEPPKETQQYVAGDKDVRVSAKEEPAAAKSGLASSPNPGAVLAPLGYRIGVDDELAIAVWHEPEFSQAVVVRPDGMITLPLLNDIQVAGLTPEEMQALLTEKLKAVVNEPQVTVSVKAIKSRKAFVVGNIAKQGTYPLTGRLTVLELIVEAGGLTPFAKAKAIYILRKENGKEIRLPFNYKKALSGGGSNPELLPGDIVVVP
jgi:polysaccharide biosynthesis/export protein